MPFELQELTQVTCVNANPRTEIHGKDLVRAIDLRFRVTSENTLLDTIAPGLRRHLFTNKAADAAQQPLPDIAMTLPNIRFPQLKTDDIKWDQPKVRGYRFIWDWGREAQHVDLTDTAMGNIALSLHEGGSLDTDFTISYNGPELEDNTLFGELCGLAAMGDLHIQLLAPAALLPVKKGWRSGKEDTPPATDGGGTLLDGERPGDEGHEHDGDESGTEHPEGSPEAALAAAEAEAAGQYPTPPATRRGRKAAAVA